MILYDFLGVFGVSILFAGGLFSIVFFPLFGLSTPYTTVFLPLGIVCLILGKYLHYKQGENQKQRTFTFNEWQEPTRKTIQIIGLSFKDKLKLCLGILIESKVVFDSSPNKVNYSVKTISQSKEKKRDN